MQPKNYLILGYDMIYNGKDKIYNCQIIEGYTGMRETEKIAIKLGEKVIQDFPSKFTGLDTEEIDLNYHIWETLRSKAEIEEDIKNGLLDIVINYKTEEISPFYRIR